MTEPLAEIDELLDVAAGLPFGPTRVAVLEEAVRRADAAGDIDQGFRTRDALMEASFNRGDLLLVHFGWCLAQHDRHPGRFDEHRILWRYKWVCGNVLSFPDVSLVAVRGLIEDMAERFDRHGAGRRAVWGYRRGLAAHVGDRRAAAAAHRRFLREPRDAMSNCPACEVGGTVRHLVFLDRPADAVDAASDVLAGRLRCRTVPQSVYSELLMPLVRLGRVADAAKYHKAALRLHAATPPTLGEVEEHVLFLAVTDNLDRAIKLADKYVPLAVGSPEPASHLSFWRAVAFLAARLRRAGRDAVRLRFPAGHPLHRTRGGLAVADLEARALAEAGELADRFDARNGNPGCRRQLDGLRALHRQVSPHPI